MSAGTALHDEGGDRGRVQYGMEGYLFFETYEIVDSNENLGEVSGLD